MKTTNARLLFLTTIGTLLIQSEGIEMPKPGQNVLNELSPELIHTGFSPAVYGAFGEHLFAKFTNPLPQDVKDLWETWAINNITEDGKVKDDFSISMVTKDTNIVPIGLGVSEDRFNEIHDLVNNVISDAKYGEEGPDTVDIITEVSKHLKSHAEIAMLGFFMGHQSTKQKMDRESEGSVKGKMLSISIPKDGGEPEIKVTSF